MIPEPKQQFFSGWIEYETETEVVNEFHRTITNNTYETFWDIGAYRGLYTLLAADHITEIYCFEPAPVPRTNLKQNCAQFNITNYTDVTIPLYNSAGYHELTVDTTSGSRTFIRGTSPLPERDTSTVTTRYTQRADELITNTPLPAPDIVKIDIEGAEYEVIQGFGDYLQEVSVFFIEIHLSENRPDKISPYLERNGFDVTLLTSRNKSNTNSRYQKLIKAERN